MKTAKSWVNEYLDSHQHPVNKLLHRICIPVIIFSLAGMLWVVPFPDITLSLFVLNWATIVLLFALGYYFFLSWRFAIGMFVFILIVYTLLFWLDKTGIRLGQISVALFIIAWIGQFIGHKIEKKRPLFLKDLQFLLIGPLFLLADIYKKLNIHSE